MAPRDRLRGLRNPQAAEQATVAADAAPRAVLFPDWFRNAQAMEGSDSGAEVTSSEESPLSSDSEIAPPFAEVT